MNLIDFMNDLVANPSKLVRYKQDPAAYLERKGTALSTEDKNLLLQFSPTLEISTVMGTGIRIPTSDLSHKNPIPLDGLQISLLSRAQTLLAELQEKAPDNYMTFRLLRRSKLYFSPDAILHINDQVNFNLRICYVDPLNPHDEPQVLYIKTKNYDSAIDKYTFDLNDAQARFTVDRNRHLLLRADQEEIRTLDHNSYLNLSEGELHLAIFNPVDGSD